MRRRIGAQGDETEDIIKYGLLLGAAAIFIIKPLLNTLGVTSEDAATVASVNTLDPTQNPFSYQFAPLAEENYWNDQSDPEQQYFQEDLVTYGQQGDTLNPLAPTYNLIVNAEAINNAFGYFAYDADTVLSIFNSLQTQTDVAYIAAYLYFNYQKDLMTLLTNGRYAPIFGLTSGLSKTDLAIIINHVMSLPVKH